MADQQDDDVWDTSLFKMRRFIEIEETDSEAEDEMNSVVDAAATRVPGSQNEVPEIPPSSSCDENNSTCSIAQHPSGLTDKQLQNLQRATVTQLDVNDTGYFNQNPYLPGGRVGRLCAPDRTLSIDPRRFRQRPFDPNAQHRIQEQERRLQLAEQERLRRMRTFGKPLAVKSVGLRLVPVVDEDTDWVDEKNAETEYGLDSDEEKESFKRRFENDGIPIFALGSSGIDGKAELRHAGLKPEEVPVPKKIRSERPAVAGEVQPIVLPHQHGSASRERLSAEAPEENVSKCDVSPGSISTEKVEFPLSDTRYKKFSSIQARRCTFPSPSSFFIDYWKVGVRRIWNIVQLNHKKNQKITKYRKPVVVPQFHDESGTVPIECSCSSPFVVPPAGPIAGMIPQKRCQATFRDGNFHLARCETMFDAKEMLCYYWLPQSEQLGAFCRNHASLLVAHKICPFCNEFCSPESEKKFAVCRGVKGASTHLYHVECRKTLNLNKCCPHCLMSKTCCLEQAFNGIEQTKFPHADDGADFSGLTNDLEFESISFPASWNLPDVSAYFESSQLNLLLDQLQSVKAIGNGSVRDKEQQIFVFVLDILMLGKECPKSLRGLDNNGNSLLHLAARAGNVGAILLLCAIGLDLNLKNATKEKDTALMIAIKSGHAAAIYALVKAGADVNVQDPLGLTPLHWSAFHRNYLAISFLLENHALCELKDVDGFTFIFSTLHWITEEQFYGVANNRVNLRVIDLDGWTLLHWIAMLGRNDLAEIFLNFEELLGVRGQFGETPLHVAVVFGNDNFMKVFKNSRAPARIIRPDHHGDTVWDLALAMEAEKNKKETTKDKLKKVKWNSTTQLLKRYIGSPDANRRYVPIGEVSGDITNGKTLIPIPCYNFLNHEDFPSDLVYSDVSVKPIIYQNPPRKRSITEPCAFFDNKVGGVRCCQEERCRCMIKERPVHCQPCNDAKNQNESHFCAAVQKGRLTNLDGRTTSRPKPPLPEEYARNLIHRLSRKAVFVAKQPQLVDDLNYISDLVRVAHLPECRARKFPKEIAKRRGHFHSVPSPRRHVRETRCASCPPDFKRNLKEWEVCKEVFVDREGNEYAVPVADDRPFLFGPTRADQKHYDFWCDNPLDLFAELQEFVVDDLIRGAVIWFERRHLLERWDLSSLNQLAPQRHPRFLPDRWDLDSFEELARRCPMPSKLWPELRKDDEKMQRQREIYRIWAQTKCKTVKQMPKSLKPSFKISNTNTVMKTNVVTMDGIEFDLQTATLEECSSFCQCSKDCVNRYSEYPTARIGLNYCGSPVGWGVIALARIMGGEIIAEYTGEIYRDMGYGSLYNDDTYIYGLRNDMIKQYRRPKTDPQVIIDARRVGNIARYLNHSCNPNVVGVEVSPHGMIYKKIILFAVRTIYPTEQLTLSYGYDWWEAKGTQVADDINDLFYCRCNEPDCSFGKEWGRAQAKKAGCNGKNTPKE